MRNEKSAVQEFLQNEQEENSPFAPTETDPFGTEELPEKKVEQEEDKVVPFAKDPKILRFIEKQVERRIAALPKSEPVAAKTDSIDDITDVLNSIIGNDTDEKRSAIKNFKKALDSRDVKIRQETLSYLQQQDEKQKEEDRRVQEQLNSGFEDIEETFSVDLSSKSPAARKLRSDFVEYVTKIAPKNAEGEVIAFPDMPAAFEEFQERTKRQAPNNSRAKELAARGVSASKDASIAPKVKDNSWRAVDKIFGSFSK